MRLGNEKGAATLSVILLISGITMELAIAGVIIAMLVSNTAFSSRLSADALAVARAGAQDAELRIVRDKNFISSGYFEPPGCVLNGSVPCARVVVEKDSGTSCSQPISSGQDCIVSLGTAFTRNRKVEAILGVDSISGKINALSLKEIPL